jgi:hypothetical protein
MSSHYHDARNIFITVLFSVFLVIYLAVFTLLLNKLKKVYPTFYSNNRTRLFILSGSIVGGLIIQSMFRYVTNAQFTDS